MNKFAFIFPGQGSQTVGMLSEIATVYSIIEQTFHEASDILNYDLWKLTQHGPIEELNETWKTQSAILTASVALWRMWLNLGGKIPTLMAGHSLGEYSALVCAGVINFVDAVYLVKIRGELMQEAANGIGAMAAIIGLDSTFIKKVCKELSDGQIVSLVNFNSPNQVVIAGHKDAVERVRLACKASGAKLGILLPVSVPSHCVLMKSAAKKLATEIKKFAFHVPIIPVVNNVDVKCETTEEAIQNALIRQLYSPVQWTKIIKFIYQQGIKHLYEVGPGNVLTKLAQNTMNFSSAFSINKPDTILKMLKKYKRGKS